LDDVVQHGPHDLYWCCHFEGNVSSYKNVKTNLKQSKVTYFKFKGQLAFITAKKMAKNDEDNLYLPQRAHLEVHNQLLKRHHWLGIFRKHVLWNKLCVSTIFIIFDQKLWGNKKIGRSLGRAGKYWNQPA
jgi:hypothetical protein